MLVLRRRRNEELLIGPDITVKVLELSGQYVRLGITAPQGVHIARAEAAEKYQGREQSPEGAEEQR
jgi:carbon storage regulator